MCIRDREYTGTVQEFHLTDTFFQHILCLLNILVRNILQDFHLFLCITSRNTQKHAGLNTYQPL